MEALARERPDLVRCDALVLADTGNVELGLPTVTTSLRGTGSVLVTVRTMEGPVHSGMYGGAAPDALQALLMALASLRDETGETTIDGLDGGRDLGRGALRRRAVPRRRRPARGGRAPDRARRQRGRPGLGPPRGHGAGDRLPAGLPGHGGGAGQRPRRRQPPRPGWGRRRPRPAPADRAPRAPHAVRGAGRRPPGVAGPAASRRGPTGRHTGRWAGPCTPRSAATW